MKRKITVLVMASLIFRVLSITAYAALPPVVTASWRSEFKKVEIVEDEPISADEVVDFTGDVGLDAQDSVVPDTTSCDEEQNEEASGGVFVIIAVEEPEEPGEPEEPIEEQQEPITTPDEADENI